MNEIKSWVYLFMNGIKSHFGLGLRSCLHVSMLIVIWKYFFSNICSLTNFTGRETDQYIVTWFKNASRCLNWYSVNYNTIWQNILFLGFGVIHEQLERRTRDQSINVVVCHMDYHTAKVSNRYDHHLLFVMELIIWFTCPVGMFCHSIGDKSGLIAGHLITSTLLSWRKSCLVLQHGLPYCPAVMSHGAGIRMGGPQVAVWRRHNVWPSNFSRY